MDIYAYMQKINEDTESLFSPYACKNANALRMRERKYKDDIIRSQYAIDADKIIYSNFFNRGADKTQVFSFFRNDDITRRASHVQLVSKIARTIGKALELNLDLIEAIAIGHDIGHTPFGHKGESFLNELYNSHTGRFFNHNVHSVRVLQQISDCNLTVQTLDGILCHCGEKAFEKYEPAKPLDFDGFNAIFNECYTQEERIKDLRPCTLEGCVVRISDMIAYIGKDRQDAVKVKLNANYNKSNPLSENNSKMITTMISDIITNSIDKPYLSISTDIFNQLIDMLNENNKQIYGCEEVYKPYFEIVKPMMEILYNRFLDDCINSSYDSLIYKHYLNGDIIGNFYRHSEKRYVELDKHNPNDIVTDFIASMTDDYFIEVFDFLYPKHKLNRQVAYIGYFDSRWD